ncbi:hypothetical protein PXK62_16570 [Phaeobacter gallaeciensis]|nr:hypothetical protein [Phaeobacter gallaeciensis]
MTHIDPVKFVGILLRCENKLNPPAFDRDAADRLSRPLEGVEQS